jgi:glycerophosphoryl diester phosphodiesterase
MAIDPFSRELDPFPSVRVASTTTRVPRQRLRRWRRRVAFLLAVVATAYAALRIARWTRDYVTVPTRAFVAGGPLVIAHRGASAVATEHTLAAYRRAVADGADVLELDVHLARDGAIIVSHDATLHRTLGVPRAIADHGLAELRAAVAAQHAGADPAELLPTFDDVVAAFPQTRLNIELKQEATVLADAVALAIDRLGCADRVLVASFHGDALAQFRATSRGRVATSAATREATRFYVCYLLEVPCRPEFEVLQIPPRLRASWPRVRLDGAAFIEFAHRHGLAVHYWTVDDEAEMTRLLAAGADGIITNLPAVATRVRAARGAP